MPIFVTDSNAGAGGGGGGGAAGGGVNQLSRKSGLSWKISTTCCEKFHFLDVASYLNMVATTHEHARETIPLTKHDLRTRNV